TTEAVQRLVGRGYLAREVDPGDRRRALITMGPDVTEVLERIYGPVAEEGAKMLREYTDEELALIAEFLERGRTLQEGQAARIRRQVAGIVSTS
ncbi:MarR family transcriptional regulator, partial [Actinomycetes bacterium KLBMP 9759]